MVHAWLPSIGRTTVDCRGFLTNLAMSLGPLPTLFAPRSLSTYNALERCGHIHVGNETRSQKVDYLETCALGSTKYVQHSQKKQQVVSRILYFGAHVSLIHQYALGTAPHDDSIRLRKHKNKVSYSNAQKISQCRSVSCTLFPGMVMTKDKIVTPILK